MCLRIEVPAFEEEGNYCVEESPSTPVGQVMGEGFIDDMFTAPATPVKQLLMTPEPVSMIRQLPLICTTPLRQISAGVGCDSESLFSARSQFSNGMCADNYLSSNHGNPFMSSKPFVSNDPVPLFLQHTRLTRDFNTSSQCQIWQANNSTWVSATSKTDGAIYTIKVTQTSTTSVSEAINFSAQHPGCVRYHNYWTEGGYVFVQMEHILPHHVVPSPEKCYDVLRKLHAAELCHGSSQSVFSETISGLATITELSQLTTRDNVKELLELSALC